MSRRSNFDDDDYDDDIEDDDDFYSSRSKGPSETVIALHIVIPLAVLVLFLLIFVIAEIHLCFFLPVIFIVAVPSLLVPLFMYVDFSSSQGSYTSDSFERGTKRPLNHCWKCSHTWYPRGSNYSAKCPKCNSFR